MKKSAIFWIVICALIFVIIGSFIYHIIYFKNFKGFTRDVSEEEKQKVIEILNQSEISYLYIKFGDVYSLGNKEIIQVELSNDGSRWRYFVDLSSGKAVKK